MAQSPRSYKRALFVFRRDLRAHDNTGLIKALTEAGEVLPCFIFDPRQYRDHPYRSLPGLEFMLESIRALHGELAKLGGELIIWEGDPVECLLEASALEEIEAVYFNRDYSPFARARDRAIHERLSAAGVNVHHFSDTLLNEPEECLKDNGTPYSVFTPFYKRSRQIAVPTPVAPPRGTWIHPKRSRSLGLEFLEKVHPETMPHRLDRGGRPEGLKVLTRAAELREYGEKRDFPAISGTSRLSAHHKFGTVSIREVFHRLNAMGPSGEPLVRQLYWRDFFTHVAFHWPHVLGKAFKPAFDRIEWSHNEKVFARWCEGSTGFPIVDAGMRELAATGYMHNRVRMIVASFLTKDLHIDWRWGERHFARSLVDYDPCVNNGSWQWAASTGCDAQPYFRIFNPWLQQAKFDPDAVYIKRWVPELSHLTPAQIHALGDESAERGRYPHPMVDHATEKVITEELFEVVKGA
ncbi:MAG: hypothetical protein RL417_1187 [Pseudomonadota bacterium]|jgi:deoxyribodipyrimidine photo-lyase